MTDKRLFLAGATLAVISLALLLCTRELVLLVPLGVAIALLFAGEINGE